MPKLTLTAKNLLKLKSTDGDQIDYFDTGAQVPGFGLRVSAKKRTWFLLYRKDGRLKRHKLGTHPPMGLADAREAARKQWLGVQVEDADPAAAKKARRTAMTFESLADRFVADYARPHKKSWRDDARRLRTICRPAWKSRAATDIQPADVRELLRSVATRRGMVTANRVRSLVSKVFRWAKQEGYLETNPAADLPTRGEETARERELSGVEIVTLWKRLENPTIFDSTIALGLKLRLLLGQRGENIHDMRWAHIDLKAGVWEIPGSEMKAGNSHVVPLAPEVLKLLKTQQTIVGKDAVYVLEGGRSRNLRRGITNKLGIDGVIPKDLRRTCATGMARAGAPRFIVSRVLGHVDNSITNVYDRFEYLDQKRVALEAWSRRVHGLLKKKRESGASVVAFQRGAQKALQLPG